jgi:hypothetical protein
MPKFSIPYPSLRELSLSKDRLRQLPACRYVTGIWHAMQIDQNTGSLFLTERGISGICTP